MKKGYVYILFNKTNTVSYIGVTSDIVRRIYEHKNHLIEGFTEKYNVTKLVYVEVTSSIIDAIKREKQLKKWSRESKEKLVKSLNPELKDIYEDIIKSV